MTKVLASYIAALFLAGGPAFAGGGPVRVGANVWPGYEPLYLARSLGFFSPDDIRLVEFPSASEVIRAFRNGQLDAAALTLDEALVLRQSSIPIKIILVMDVSDGGDVILAKPEIKDFSGLKGKRVAVESTALGAYVLSRALEIHGMALSGVQVVRMDVDTHERAYMDGRVDAVITFEPVRTRLLNKGAREIFSSKQLPGEIVDVLVIKDSPDSLPQEKLRALIRGWFAAVDRIRTHPEESARTMARRLGIGEKEVLASYQGIRLASKEQNRSSLGGPKPSLYTVIGRLKKSMVDNNLLSPQTQMEGAVTAEYLPD